MEHRNSSIHTDFDYVLFAQNGIRLEHAQVFALVAEFLGSVRSDAKADRVLNLLERIIKLTLDHCRSEENILRHVGSPSLGTQCETHRRILEELTDFRDGMMTCRGASASEYLHLLDMLIIHHVRDESGFEDLDKQVHLA